MKIFISGKMSGEPDYNRPAFNRLADELKRLGFIPLNPAIFPDGLTYDEYMTLSMAMLGMSDSVIMLPGWEESKGARIEYEYATQNRIEIHGAQSKDIYGEDI